MKWKQLIIKLKGTQIKYNNKLSNHNQKKMSN